MSSMQAKLSPDPQPNPEGIAELSITVGEIVLTRLVRSGTSTSSDAARIPAAPLGFWIADHWWRLRWEPKSANPNDDWRIAHSMPAIGHGHAWPPITIWGDRDRVMLVSRADPPGVASPVRYLTNAVAFARGTDFEAVTDSLLDASMAMAPEREKAALKALIQALREERASPEYTKWRRMEALCGFDPDEAPETLVESMLENCETYGVEDAEEAASAAPGLDTATTLANVVALAERGPTVDFGPAVEAVKLQRQMVHGIPPWVLAEEAAKVVRRQIVGLTEPVWNKRLAELAAISVAELKDRNTESVPYGLRLSREGVGQNLLMTARWSFDRRFQLARAIGDAVWTGGSSLGPMSGAATARQKFQRAFAATLLCPIEGLDAFLDGQEPTDSDIAAAARHFHVNERTVRTVLVNKHLMERRRLGQPLSDPTDESRLDQVAEVA
ncbi:hypothetical protein P7L66_01230 (plasmid) [Tistrella mobilis]|uniref:hypothetical protein n=1 Tax=Tistrella mobilis TaxID=171437 RepID=UPI00355701D7